MSVAVNVLLVVNEGVDHLPGLGVGVGLVSIAVELVVEGAVEVPKYNAVFGLALVADVVHCSKSNWGCLWMGRRRQGCLWR